MSVLTFGPGDHPFYKFGHDAILVHDALHHRDDVYNYGTFNYRSASLIGDFLKGRLRYWLSVEPLAATLAEYQSENRSVLSQELALSPAQRRALLDRLVTNALPENRAYRYDYYRDNCATRVRDVVDAVVGGRLRAASTSPARFTFREETERLTAGDLLVYLGLDVAMGDAIDKPVPQWDAMFLPSRVEEQLRRVTLPTAAGDVPLVARETVVLDALRPPERDGPPRWAVPMGFFGVAWGALLAALGYRARASRVARATFGVLLGVVGLAAGLLGSIFVFFWVATDHFVAHHNENILLCSPLGLPLAVFAGGVALGIERARRPLAILATVVAVGAIAELALKALPWFDQANGAFIAAWVPLWIGAALGARSNVGRA